MGNHPDRAMMHVHFYEQVDDLRFANLARRWLGRLFAVWREVGLMARLWRARDIVPFV